MLYLEGLRPVSLWAVDVIQMIRLRSIQAGGIAIDFGFTKLCFSYSSITNEDYHRDKPGRETTAKSITAGYCWNN